MLSSSPPNEAAAAPRRPWVQTLRSLFQRNILAMLLLGFSAGIPLLLIFSSLSLWLGEAGVERKAVTMFSWAALGYSFKFVWAPLVDRMPLPLLTRWMGRRRSWLLLAQTGVMASIWGMSMVDPSQGTDSLHAMAWFAVALGFTAATQDIVIDAWRIESAGTDMQALMSSAYIAGYRVGMIVSGAGALYLASYWGSTKEAYQYGAWALTYQTMATVLAIGWLTTWWIQEPKCEGTVQSSPAHQQHARTLMLFVMGVAAFVATFSSIDEWMVGWKTQASASAWVSLAIEFLKLSGAVLAALAVGFLAVRARLVDAQSTRETWLAPVLDFFKRYQSMAFWVLALIGLYRISDIVLGVISNVFYQDLGYTKPEIATAVKTFGVVVSILGGFWGGIWANRWGMMRSLWWGAVLSALTNLLFVGLASWGPTLPGLYLVIAADNLAAGFASAAFVAFLSSLTQVQFTAVQYAIFSSLMTLLPKTLGGYSGAMVDHMGYPGFFALTTMMGLPVLALVAWIKHRMPTS